VNGVEYPTQVNAEGVTWSVVVPGSELALDDNVHATVTTTDAAGNSATAENNRGYGVDVTAPEASIEIDTIAGDNVINAEESEQHH
ncbi:Ig-like domain-containing protein, partial [Escherichia coli]|uniref:Ig-like domain-containing protein n=1 Tax=Escherichia coli TaxID=562 RepID=UPI0027387D33